MHMTIYRTVQQYKVEKIVDMQRLFMQYNWDMRKVLRI